MELHNFALEFPGPLLVPAWLLRLLSLTWVSRRLSVTWVSRPLRLSWVSRWLSLRSAPGQINLGGKGRGPPLRPVQLYR